MNYSNVFKSAHAQAKYTRAFFPSYRGAFSTALSQIMRQSWAEFKASLKAKKDKEFKKAAKAIQKKTAASGRGLVAGKRVAKVRLGILSDLNSNLSHRPVMH
ncbi:hypothetical protein VCHA31O73_360033 [Vibrio chagasii]|nr:hypothetical protein VCHA31O73_360033 [Vibrio chagasii]